MSRISDRCIFVTGGAGFIGSAVVRELLKTTDAHVVNIDCLTYAGNIDTLSTVSELDRYHFSQTDIRDLASLEKLFEKYAPIGVMHLAAETHVDRSIDAPGGFLDTNIFGTYNLLQASRKYVEALSSKTSGNFIFHHVSTDEVFGALGLEGIFTENSSYNPRSPYAASKASSDHLVRAWSETYGLESVVSNCSNNYGPYQYPEKLIPVVIDKALKEQPIPIYGSGANIRDWLYVDDHARALVMILDKGVSGRSYNVGAGEEKSNLSVVDSICNCLDRLVPRENGNSYIDLISFVKDRPGHDFRYAIDSARIRDELGWGPQETFASGIAKTVEWYLSNQEWVRGVSESNYDGQRLGLGRML